MSMFGDDLKNKITTLVKNEHAVTEQRAIELQYQEDGALVVEASRRILDFYPTLQEACEDFGPDSGFGVPVKIRALSHVRSKS